MSNLVENTFNNYQLMKGKIKLEDLYHLLIESKNQNILNVNNTDKLLSFIVENLKTQKKKSPYVIKTRNEEPKAWIDSLDSIIISFMSFLKNEKRYATSSTNASIRNLKRFTEFMGCRNKNGSGVKTEFTTLTKRDILDYEDYLINRYNDGEIEKNTIYKYLYVVELFVDFLRKDRKTLITYNVPAALKNNGNRTNIYALTQDIVKLIETVEQQSSFRIRDMCVLLLIMELGCRPIEAAGVSIDDLRLSESLITLYCVKSGQRTLKISKELTKLFKKYLEIRQEYNPDHNNVFINVFGEPLSRNGISSMIYHLNKRTFGKAKINAKALRHTYATNALDNLNDFDEVSKSMGHLHWASTEYYVHKSIKRLLKNSLPFNPLHPLLEGDEHNGTN
jgi:site-specific recombinase XerD